MPKIRRQGIPEALLQHLYDRAKQREFTYDQLTLMYHWLERDRIVPEGKWFKRFPGMIVCGDGEWIKTFLRSGQAPTGEEVF